MNGPTSAIAMIGPPGKENSIRGLGVLVSSQHVLTCAHVVNLALAQDKSAQAKPDEPVAVSSRKPIIVS